MRFGRRRKHKEKQRAAWDAVAATLEAPPGVSGDDIPVVAPSPDAAATSAPPRAPGDEAFAPVTPEPVTPAPPAPPAPPEADAPVAPATPPVPEAPAPAVDVPDAPPVAPPSTPPAAPPPAPPAAPPPSRPPVFRFTPTGTVEVPTPTAPVAPVAPDPPLTVVPDPEPPAATGLATTPPLAPTGPVTPVAPVAPSEPDEAPPVAPRLAPEPHATLPVFVAPPSHLAPPSQPAPPAAPPSLPAPTGRIATIPHSTRAVAERMRHALDEMVQLSMHMDAWMDQAVEMRTQLLSEWDDDTLRPSYTDFVVRAVARALVQHPELNAVIRGDSIELLPQVHVGITLPGRDGIDIPVVRDADRRNLKSIAAASLGIDDALVGPRSLLGPSATAPDGVAWRAPDDTTPAPPTAPPPGSESSALDTDVATDAPASFVVASLGVYGVDAFTPVVMSPNVATLAIGRVRDATRWEGDHPTRASAMTLTLAWDHRAVDGTTAAEFLAEVRDILEQPYRLLVD
ncbi:MAG TPA: 2-oxo acid dehydrogenase subunit E2 [Acidimicrobiia bacterium]|nr:2-oxo acid dehydrogenase subunit E2 [Acidimicrobiia bacterium]